jgi:hypothetical protein
MEGEDENGGSGGEGRGGGVGRFRCGEVFGMGMERVRKEGEG